MLSFYDKIAYYKNSEQKLNSKNGISWSISHLCKNYNLFIIN